jgi:hypothetical protein
LETVQKLQGKKWYAKLDLKQSYYQLELDRNARRWTAFTTNSGTYEFTRCPFGLKNAPGIFQAVMREILQDYIDEGICEVFIDDIIIFGDSEAQFEYNVSRVLQRLLDRNVKLNGKKCTFGVSTIKYVGYICDAKGYRIDPERYEALKNVKIPDTPTQLRKFLGLANTFRSTIRNYATLASPLHKIWTAGSASLKGKGRKVYEEAFNALRAAIVEDVKLFFPNYAYSMVLRVDASLQGVGAYLLQINDKEEEEPIVFFSQAFSDVATRWSTIEQEAYAIYYGVTKCESYLMGQPFFLETDHRNLLYIDKATAPKVVRWKLILQQYNFRLVHIPGVTNVIADALLRLFAMSAEAQGLPPRYKLKSIEKSASPYNSSNGPGNISRTKRRNLDVKHGSGTVTKRLKTIPLDEVDWNPDDPDDVMSSHQEDSDQPDQDSNGRESAGEADSSKQYTVV